MKHDTPHAFPTYHAQPVIIVTFMSVSLACNIHSFHCKGSPYNRLLRPLGWGWSAPRPGRFTPGKDPVPIAQEAGWAPGPVWTGAENLAHTGIRSPDRPARSKSLYRLSYPGRSFHCTVVHFTMLLVHQTPHRRL